MLIRLRTDLDELVEEMLNHLPQKYFKSKTTTFLDPMMGSGQFVSAIENRLRAHGHSDKNIANRVFGIEHSWRVQIAKNRHNLVGVMEIADFLEDDILMEFDVIVGNPPFQKSSDDSTSSNLWSDFYEKSFDWLKADGILAMITPNTWAAPKLEGRPSQTTAVRDIIANHAKVVNIDECSRHFPTVGSSFTYSIVTKKSTVGSKVKVITPLEEMEIDNLPDIINNLPRTLTKQGIDIFNKVLSRPMFEKASGATPSGNMIHERDRNSKNKKKYKFPVQYAAGTIKWCDKENRYQYDKKVLFPGWTSHDYPIYDSGEMASPIRGATFLVKSDRQGKNFVNFVKSKLMKFIISQRRYHHGVLSIAVVSEIPVVDLKRKWTDEELYQEFGLTQKEIEYVESY